MRMKSFLLGMALVLLAVGCADTPEPAPEPPTVDTQEQDELVQNTENIAAQLCESYGPYRTAKEYGVSNPEDFDAVAEGYASGSIMGPHRFAAYRGCYRGLYEWQLKN